MMYLIPSKFDHCRAYLPDLATRRSEITRWRMKFHDGFENIPIYLQQSLSYAHEDVYLNIRRIFTILLTRPVTIACCEISFSSFYRLITWERATISEERLCILAMFHIHREMNVSGENTLRRFDETGHRTIGKLQFE